MRIKKIEFIYFLAIGIILVNYFLGISSLVLWNETISDIVNLIAYILLIIKIMHKVKVKNVILYSLILAMTLVAYLNSGLTSLTTCFLIIIASKDIKLKNIIKFVFFINCIVLFIHMTTYIINYIIAPDTISIIYRENKPRYNFFLGHPNNFSAIFIWTTLMYFYLVYEKFNWKNYLIGIIIALFIYFVPNSKTSTILIMSTLILLPFFKKNIKFITNISKISIPFLALTVIVLSLTYNINPIANELDNIFSSRLRLGAAIYENYGIHLLGEYIPLEKNVTNSYKYGLTALTIDSAYQVLIFSYGVINTVLFISIYTILNFRKNIDSKKILFLTIWALFAVTESLALNPLICFPLLFATDLIKAKGKGEQQ